MIKKVGFVALLLLSPSGYALASTSCAVPSISTPDNATVQGTMYVASGKRCSIVINHTRGPIYTTALVTPARIGKVSINGYRVTYIARPGYTGGDHFAYVRRGTDAVNRPITRTIEVDVTVQTQL